MVTCIVTRCSLLSTPWIRNTIKDIGKTKLSILLTSREMKYSGSQPCKGAARPAVQQWRHRPRLTSSKQARRACRQGGWPASRWPTCREYTQLERKTRWEGRLESKSHPQPPSPCCLLTSVVIIMPCHPCKAFMYDCIHTLVKTSTSLASSTSPPSRIPVTASRAARRSLFVSEEMKTCSQHAHAVAVAAAAA